LGIPFHITNNCEELSIHKDLGAVSINLPLDAPTPLRFLISVGFLLVWFKGEEVFFFFGSTSGGIETLDEKSIRVFVRRRVLVAGANGATTMSIKMLAYVETCKGQTIGGGLRAPLPPHGTLVVTFRDWCG